MYDRFQAILDRKNLTAYNVAKNTGISTVTLTAWKQGKYTPKIDKLIKIAEYLDCDVKELMK